MASERVTNKWMALCRKGDIDATAAAASPVRIHGVISKPDAGNPSDRVSIFSPFKSDPKSGLLEKFSESRSDLEQVLTSFGAFCELMTRRLEADEDAVAGVGLPASSPGAPSRPSRNQSDTGQLALASESVLREWMAICRKADKDAMSAPDSPGATSKQDAGNPSEGVSIFSSFQSDPKSCHLERSLESRSDLEQAVTSFGAFCKLMTVRLEPDEDAVPGVGLPASSLGATSRPSRNQSDAGQLALASESVLREWMAICRKTDKDAMSAADSPRATSKQDAGNPSEGVSIFSFFQSDPKSCHLERSPESRSDLEQAVTSFVAFCKLMTVRLEPDEDAVAGVGLPASSPGTTSRPSRNQSDAGQLPLASESVLREWMVICRKTDKEALAAAVSPLRTPGATSKQDAGNPSEGVSIFSSFISPPESDHVERFQEAQTNFEQVLTSFSAFCKSMTVRLEADEDAVAALGFPASSPGATSRPSRHLKRVSSADGLSRIQRIRTRRCSSCDGRESRRFDCKLLATDGRWSFSLPEIAL